MCCLARIHTIIALLAVTINALRQVVWSATARQSRPAPATFEQWFREDPSVPKQLLLAADAISDVKPIGANRFEARVSTTTFPLVTLQPVIELAFDRSPEGAEVVVSRRSPTRTPTLCAAQLTLEAQKMEVSGPAWV